MAEEVTSEELEPIEIIEQNIAGGYSWTDAAAGVSGNPYVFEEPILGFTEGDITDPIAPGTYASEEIPEAGVQPILRKDVIDALPDYLDADAQALLAMEMFLNVDAAYGDIGQVFEEDGSVNQETFMMAVDTTLQYAAKAGPVGYDTTTKYLNILTSASGASVQDLQQQFQEEQKKSSGTFPGIVLNRIADTGFSSVLGRTASKREQQLFSEMILELGDSIKSEGQVALEAEEFAREQNPQEAQLMDYRGAADRIMSVMGFA
jgi:hypothetical protein